MTEEELGVDQEPASRVLPLGLTALEAKVLLMDLDQIGRDDDWDFNVWKAAVRKIRLVAAIPEGTT
jgi:hypothetical protein